ncbi:MAG: chloramphenicol acetyltransferase [Anaerolineales bacterium]|jgi:chloramphenicol O-acetyltransferase type A
MRTIDLENWPRRQHFEVYSQFDFPHFNLTFPVEVTQFHAWVKARHDSLNIAATYLLSRAANEMPAFRLRIHGEQVVEHTVVHPSFTVLLESELFSFCTVEYRQDYESFHLASAKRIDEVRSEPTIEDQPGQDDLLFMTSIPWVHFTSVMHPIHMHPVDSVPRIAWGRIVGRENTLRMPLSVQVHHGLMDGLHVGRYAERVQHLFNNPEELLG